MRLGSRIAQMKTPTSWPRTVNAQRGADLDLHGIVGMRLLGASPADVAVACRETGAVERVLDRAPNLVIRFYERLPFSGIAWTEPGRGVTEDGWLVLRHKGTTTAIDLAGIGHGCCEVHCQQGAASLHVLSDVVSLIALQQDCAAVHGAAFVLDGTGVLIAGLAHSGKTGILLAFAERGAQYLGDECIFLRGNGQTMYGTARDFEVRSWHLDNLPRLCSLLPPKLRALWQGMRYLERLTQEPDHGTRAKASHLVRKPLPILRRRLRARIPAVAVFGSRVGNPVGRPDKVVLSLSQPGPSITVERADRMQVALQIQTASCWTRGDLWKAYQAGRLSFLKVQDYFLERAAQIHREILCRAIRNCDTWVLRHPYPFLFSDLYAAMEPVLGTGQVSQSLPKSVPAEIAVTQRVEV